MSWIKSRFNVFVPALTIIMHEIDNTLLRLHFSDDFHRARSEFGFIPVYVWDFVKRWKRWGPTGLVSELLKNLNPSFPEHVQTSAWTKSTNQICELLRCSNTPAHVHLMTVTESFIGLHLLACFRVDQSRLIYRFIILII